VRQTGYTFSVALLTSFAREAPSRDRHDLVVVAVHDQHRYGDRLQVLVEVRLRECLDAVVVRLGAAHHSLAPPVVDHAFRRLGARTVVAIERTRGYVTEKLRAIGEQRGTETVEDLDRRAARILRRLDHDRRHRADQHGFRDASLAVPRDVPGDLAAAGRMSDVNGVAQVEVRGQGRDVRGIRVHLVAGRRLRRAPVAPAIVGDHAEPLRQEKHHLGIPIVGGQRPAVMEDDGLPGAPVFVEDLGAVLGRDRAHGGISWKW
jgi:hypothetical protein